ncbi:MAG: DUF3800 domain-containing protein [Beijerinckiaceae bacterium]|nr:DUF3800 domain-containing protein [Beijerinckiaceae bacterium]
MLVFIDESGDPGFKIERGASPIFVVAMVIFEDDTAARRAQECIQESDVRRAHASEFKFNKCSFDVRDRFFSCVQTCDFKVRAIVVRKDRIYSPRLKADKESFYQYFVNQMMRYDNRVLRDAKVVIDGSGDREFRQNLNAQLRKRLGQGVIRSVRFRDSAGDVLVQLADMCAGAIARSYRPDRPEANRWREALRPKIDDVWDFK